MPSNSMIVAAPTRPTVGRCTAALVAKLGDRRGGWAEAQPLGEQRARAGDRGEVHAACAATRSGTSARRRRAPDARAKASASENPKVASPTRPTTRATARRVARRAVGERSAARSSRRRCQTRRSCTDPRWASRSGATRGAPVERGTRAGRARRVAHGGGARARGRRGGAARRRSPRSWTERRSRPPCLSRLRRSGRSGSAARGARARWRAGDRAPPRGRRRRR